MEKTVLVLALALLCALAAVVAGCGQDLTTTTAEAAATTVMSTPETVTDTTAGPETTETTPTTATPPTTAAEPTTSTTKAPPAPPAWTKLDPGGPAPSGREGAAMVCNPATGRVVMFGGTDWVKNYDDLWVYNPEGNAWIALSPAGSKPSARKYATLVYDSVNKKILLFGGGGSVGQSNDLWAYDPPTDTWTKLSPSGALPQAREKHSAFFDPKTKKMYVFGGKHGTSTFYNDLWAYDVVADKWAKLTPAGSVPAARVGAVMAYNPDSGRAFLWGGGNLSGDLDDAWAYDPPTNTWIPIPLSGAQPSARSYSALVYDPAGKRMVLFGGFENGGEMQRDTWSFKPSTGAWTKLDPTGALPDARSGHMMAYATGVGKIVLFGGTNDEGHYSDTWVYGISP